MTSLEEVLDEWEEITLEHESISDTAAAILVLANAISKKSLNHTEDLAHFFALGLKNVFQESTVSLSVQGDLNTQVDGNLKVNKTL